jgi:hypothetical protein
MKPNIQLAEFLRELLATEYDENKKEEVLSNFSQKWRIERERIEFYLEAIDSYYCRDILASMVASASYDESFMEVFRAMDYLNGRIDAQGNLKMPYKIRGFISGVFRSNSKWLFIVCFTIFFVYLIKLIGGFLLSLFR